MSVRAHLIMDIKYNGESLNITHDTEFLEFIDRHCSEVFARLNDDCVGEFEIYIEDWIDFKKYWLDIGREEFSKSLKHIEFAQGPGYEIIYTPYSEEEIKKELCKFEECMAQINADFEIAKVTDTPDYVRYRCF